MQLNLQPISNVLGVLMILLGISMFGTALVSWYYDAADTMSFLQAGGLTVFFGAISWMYRFSSSAVVNKKEGYLIVALGWVFMGSSHIPKYNKNKIVLFCEHHFSVYSLRFR